MNTVIFVVVAVAAFVATVESVDYRCQFTETKVANCTRTVYYPCPEQTGSDEEDDSDSDSNTDSDSNSDSDSSDSDAEESGVEDFIARIMRRWFRGSSDTDWCKRDETFTCVMYRCYIGCCPGWKLDEETQTCSIQEDTTPSITCNNGGHAVRGPEGWRCSCPSTHTGTYCDEAICTLDCQNDGMCDVVHGRPKCICPDNFTGPSCENPVCKGGCGMYGQCVAEDGEAVCQCSTGYRGRHCDTPIPKPEKEGDCPPVTSTTTGTCVMGCQEDAGCPNKQKCCNNGCGQVCMHPANYTCSYDSFKFNIGAVFNPDPCTTCTCLTPDPSKPYGGAQCRVMSCPALKEGCVNIVRNADACCPYCGDTRQPDTYQEPRFLNCPHSILTIDVQEDRNYAKLPFDLEAEDYEGNQLTVTVPRSEFRAGIGEQNFDTIMATSSRDDMDNFAYCEFHVRIRDVHPPKFTYCPSDVVMTKEGPAHWEDPKAEDNVGLARLPSSKHHPGQTFKKGEHPVVYSTEDHEGNMARCHFFVKVGEYDAFGMRKQTDDEKNRHFTFIGIGVAAFLLIIVITIIATLCRRRHTREPPVTPPAYENGIYNIGAPMPPPYKEKPPVYMEEVIPEKKGGGKGDFEDNVYEEPPENDKEVLDAGDVDIKMGVDNPTYRM